MERYNSIETRIRMQNKVVLRTSSLTDLGRSKLGLNKYLRGFRVQQSEALRSRHFSMYYNLKFLYLRS